MKRLHVTWLFATILIVSCQKSAIDNSSPTDQESRSKSIGWHSYSVTITPVNNANTTCNDLMLNVATDKNSKGKFVLSEYEGPYHHTVLHKWETSNTNNAMMNTGKSNLSQRYFDATFTWGSTIIISDAKVFEIKPCTK